MKIIKFLAYVGLASTAAYVAYILSDKSDEYSNRKSNASDRNRLKRRSSNFNRNERNDDNSESHSDTRTQMMYKNLSMTADQKRRYEEDYHALTGDWQKDNPNYDMDDQQRVDYQDATLKAVLNEVQYAMYRDAPRDKHS